MSKPITIFAPDSLIKAHGKVSGFESISIHGLHRGNVLVRLDDCKPRARFIITTPKVLTAVAKAARKAQAQWAKEQAALEASTKTITIRRPKTA